MEDNNADCLLCNPAQDFGNSSPTGRPHGLLAKDPAPLNPGLTPSASPKIAMLPVTARPAGAWRFFLAPGKWLD